MWRCRRRMRRSAEYSHGPSKIRDPTCYCNFFSLESTTIKQSTGKCLNDSSHLFNRRKWRIQRLLHHRQVNCDSPKRDLLDDARQMPRRKKRQVRSIKMSSRLLSRKVSILINIVSYMKRSKRKGKKLTPEQPQQEEPPEP